MYSSAAHVFKESPSHLKIRAAKTVTRSKYHTDSQHILGATVQNVAIKYFCTPVTHNSPSAKFQILKIIPPQPNTNIQIVFSANSADMLSLTCPTTQNHYRIIRNIFYTVIKCYIWSIALCCMVLKLGRFVQ
jgi:hypothetical protein